MYPPLYKKKNEREKNVFLQSTSVFISINAFMPYDWLADEWSN